MDAGDLEHWTNRKNYTEKNIYTDKKLLKTTTTIVVVKGLIFEVGLKTMTSKKYKNVITLLGFQRDPEH